MRAMLSPSWSHEICRRSEQKQLLHSTKSALTSAVSLPVRFQRQTLKIRKHCSTRARRSTTRGRHTNVVELYLSTAESRRKSSKPRNSISPPPKTNCVCRNRPLHYEHTRSTQTIAPSRQQKQRRHNNVSPHLTRS